VVPELFYTIQVIYRRNLEVIPLLMAATVRYLIILSVLSVSQYFIERHYSRGAVRNPFPMRSLRRPLTGLSAAISSGMESRSQPVSDADRPWTSCR
jgi:polar amino acid transport system permease protein